MVDSQEQTPDFSEERTAQTRSVEAGKFSLEAQQLSKSFGRRNVLHEVSLKVGPGEVVGVVGPNGAGKTTLLQLLMGLLPADDGRVFLSGRDISHEPTYRRARLGLGYLPQERSAFEGLSVTRNVEAVLQLRRHSLQTSSKILEVFGLSARKTQRASTLSGGERRRLELSRLFAAEPWAVLLDEPFKGLDSQVALELKAAIQSRSAKGACFLVIDHAIEQVLAICQRLYVLMEGRIIASGSAQEMARHPGVYGRSGGHRREDPPTQEEGISLVTGH